MTIYLGSVTRAFIPIQLLGLAIGTAVMFLPIWQQSDSVIDWITDSFFITFMGLIITFIPTVVYSFALPGLIIGMHALGYTRKCEAYIASVVLKQPHCIRNPLRGLHNGELHRWPGPRTRLPVPPAGGNFIGMTTVLEIERAIEQLPSDQFSKIHDWSEFRLAPARPSSPFPSLPRTLTLLRV